MQTDLTGFEIMAANDCEFVGGWFWQENVAPWLRHGMNMAAPSSVIISAVTGFLILSSKENRNKYPHKFIGLICIFQSASIFFLNSFDKNYCDCTVNPWIANMLITPTSYISKNWLNGWHLTSYSDLDIAGVISIMYVICYNSSVFVEMLLSVCLNFDVVSTIHNPFSRNENLKYILIFMQCGFIGIILMALDALGEQLNYAVQTGKCGSACINPAPDQYKEMMVHHTSFYLNLKTYFNSPSLTITIVYNFISLYCLIVTAWSYLSSRNKMSKDVSTGIFKKQMIYFLVLNFMELPHTIVIYLRYVMMNTGKGFDKEDLMVEAKYYVWFTLRGTVLPMLRLIEPSFVNQLKKLIKSIFCMK